MRLFPLVFLILIVCWCGCQQKEEGYTQEILAECQKWRAKECKKGCSGGDFRICYFDNRYAKEEVDPRQECVGLIVGHSCEPCSEIFALNFAGAVKEVSCEDFLSAIANRNRECGDCVKRFNLGG